MLKALLLEDLPQDVEIIRNLLIDAGFDLDMDCTAAEKEFTSLLHSRTYNIILSDFKLPGFDGFTALRWAIEICPTVPFIFVSGTIGEEAAVELLKQGAVDYVLKDRMAKLPSAIKRALSEAKEKESHRLIEQALYKSEKKFRKLLASTPLPICYVNRDGKITFRNERFVKVFGYTNDEVPTLAEWWINAYPDEQYRIWVIQNWESAVRRASETGTDIESEVYHITCKDGSLREIIISGITINDNLLATFVDITARKLAEEALTASEVRYRRLFEAARDGILILDAETGIIVDVNPFLLEMLGYSYEEIVGKAFWELGFFKDIASNKENFLELQQEEYMRYENLPLESSYGLKFDVEFVSNVYLVNNKKVIQCNIRDITERKRAEKKLSIISSRQEAILSAVPDIIMEVNNNKVYTWANQAGIDFFGEDVIGKDASFYFEGKQDTYKIVQPLFKGEEDVIYVESWQRSKDGEKRLLAWWCRVLKDGIGNVTGALSSANDITERKLAEKEIRRLNIELEARVVERTAQLEATNKELEAFSYSVSHDLRAPLRAISGFANMLMEDFSPSLNTEAKRLLDVITTNAMNMGNLIDDLLTFSRLGRQEIKTIKINMEGMANSVYNELVSDYEKDKIDFQALPIPDAFGDPSMIRQVWRNLISNSIKYSSTKTNRTIEIGTINSETENMYYVKDNGVGFNMEFVHKLFGVFQRLHCKSEFEGTGVGLANVQRIIHRHGGRVWAEGKVDEGAAFYFTLPSGQIIRQEAI